MFSRYHFEHKIEVSALFKPACVPQVYFLEKGETINARSYIRNCLNPVVDAINEQRPLYKWRLTVH